jgi:hypothetical protein
MQKPAVVASLIFSVVLVAGPAAGDVVCRECKPVLASDAVFSPPSSFPSGSMFGPDGKSPLSASRAYIVRLSPKTGAIITTSREVLYPSQALIYRVDPSTDPLTLTGVWITSSSQSTVYIANPQPNSEAILLVAAYQEQTIAGNHKDCSMCLDIVYLQDKMRILMSFANSMSIGADDSTGDGDYNDIVVNIVCADIGVEVPNGVMKIALH